VLAKKHPRIDPFSHGFSRPKPHDGEIVSSDATVSGVQAVEVFDSAIRI
jgi:hypothetical protein